MPSTAGQMTTTPTGNPQWRACDHSIVWGFQNPVAPQTNRPHTGTSTGTYRDWVRQMGFNRTSGIGGWHVKVPRDPGATYYVAVTDDSSDTPTNVTNDARHPPAGVK